MSVLRRDGRACSCTEHWGETGGTLGDKDKEIRVRTGKFTKQPSPGHNATNGVFTKGYVGNKGLNLAPQVGFEPTTLRLTAERLIAASHCKHKAYTRENPIIAEFGGTLGVLHDAPSGASFRKGGFSAPILWAREPHPCR